MGAIRQHCPTTRPKNLGGYQCGELSFASRCPSGYQQTTPCFGGIALLQVMAAQSRVTEQPGHDLMILASCCFGGCRAVWVEMFCYCEKLRGEHGVGPVQACAPGAGMPPCSVGPVPSVWEDVSGAANVSSSQMNSDADRLGLR